MKSQFISSDDAIKGIKESKIAKEERNDCVVRAIASAFNVEYNKAHELAATKLGRKSRQGTNTATFFYQMGKLEREESRFNRKKVTEVVHEHDTLLYWVEDKLGNKSLRHTTTAHFTQRYNKGSYIVVVEGHAFTIKDGVIIGNRADAQRRRKRIQKAWKIG